MNQSETMNSLIFFPKLYLHKKKKRKENTKTEEDLLLESRTNNGLEAVNPVELQSTPRLLRGQVCSFFVLLE